MKTKENAVAIDYVKVEQLMAEKNIKQVHLSQELGYEKTWFSDGKRNNRPWRIPVAKHLALYLGVALEDIIVKETLPEEPQEDMLTAIYNKLIEISNRTVVMKKELDALKETMVTKAESEKPDLGLVAEADYIKQLFAVTRQMYEARIMKEARLRGFAEEDIRSALRALGFSHSATKGNGNTYQRLWTRPDTYKEMG